MNNEKLVRMANQIAVAFRQQPQAEALAATAQHIKDYWNPLMRREIYAHMDAGAAGLDPMALGALQHLRATDPAGAKAGA